MKNKKIWYLGYIIAVACFVVGLATDIGRQGKIVTVILGSVVFSVTYIQTMHNKMVEKDSEYKVLVNDERAQKIREKIGAAMNVILMTFIGISSIIFLYLEYYLPAIFLIAMLLVSPIIMIILGKFYEKKF